MRSWHEDLEDQLTRHEGWRSSAYKDHLGFLTIGYGRLIDARRGGGLSEGEGRMLLRNDIARVIAELSSRLPWFQFLPPRKKQALANMAYQLGINGVLNFKRMIQALQGRHWATAECEALDSLWARQTPSRAREIARMLGEDV